MEQNFGRKDIDMDIKEWEALGSSGKEGWKDVAGRRTSMGKSEERKSH